MNFALATLTDDSYIIGTKILIYSFLRNNPWFDGDIFIIYDFLNNTYIEDLKKIYTNIKLVCVNPEKYSEVNKLYDIHKTRFRNVFYKYEVFDLKGYDRVLFLDSDMLITKSFEDLMRYDYNGNIGMVPDYGFIKPKKFKITNGVIDDSFKGWYCGGGLFIIDNIILSLYSTRFFLDLALQNIQYRHDGVMINQHLFGNYPELDVLNDFFKGRILPIDIKHNFYLNTFSFREAVNCGIRIEDLYGIHYVTKNKPWNSDLPKHRMFTVLWKKYYNQFKNSFKLDSEIHSSSINGVNKFSVLNESKIPRTDDIPIEIDYVMPFVDNNDPIWQKLLETRSAQYSIPFSKNSPRYNDYGLLKYHLRGVEKNLPFIRNVYLILSGPSLIPSWLNTDKVKIVYHSDIIPEKLLPTFNSTCIEMFLHNIPGLSNYFIYANDDMYSVNRMYKSDFFDKDTLFPKLLSTRFNGKVMSDYKKTLANSEIFLRKLYNLPEVTNDIFLDGSHSIVPMRLDHIKELWEANSEFIYKSCTPFRSPRNMNLQLWNYNLILSNRYSPLFTLSLEYCNLDADAYKKLLGTKANTICINDTTAFDSQTFLRVKNSIVSAFDRLLPNKSKYEN